VTVSGAGSLWQVNGGLTIGNADSGSQLSVNAKGTAVLDTVTVGGGSLGGGTISVSGSGSKLSVTGLADFGAQRNGILSMQSGAVVTLGSATFGDTGGSLGQVTLTGAGTTLNVMGTLTLGGSGTAVMTLGAGTSFNAGNLFIGPGGVLTTAGGAIGGYTPSVGPALTAGLATFGAGTATNGTTADPTVNGTISAANTLVSLRVGLGSALPSAFEDITSRISAGAFTFTQAELTALNGGTLPDGRYVLHFIATDQLGIQTTADVTITLQTAAPTVQNFSLSQSSAVGGSGNVTADAVVSLTGATTPGSTVALVGVTGAQTVAGPSGVFQFANVPVAEGSNPFTVKATNGLGRSAQAQTTVTRQGTASTDVSMQWNQVVLNTIASLAMQAPDASQLMAIVSLAQYDTLAAIEGTQAYMVQMSVTGPVSEQAALAQTAYEVLVSLFPVLRARPEIGDSV
jgi:T5SS/PEP-CTERM-associated repeat protein